MVVKNKSRRRPLPARVRGRTSAGLGRVGWRLRSATDSPAWRVARGLAPLTPAETRATRRFAPTRFGTCPNLVDTTQPLRTWPKVEDCGFGCVWRASSVRTKKIVASGELGFGDRLATTPFLDLLSILYCGSSRLTSSYPPSYPAGGRLETGDAPRPPCRADGDLHVRLRLRRFWLRWRTDIACLNQSHGHLQLASKRTTQGDSESGPQDARRTAQGSGRHPPWRAGRPRTPRCRLAIGRHRPRLGRRIATGVADGGLLRAGLGTIDRGGRRSPASWAAGAGQRAEARTTPSVPSVAAVAAAPPAATKAMIGEALRPCLRGWLGLAGDDLERRPPRPSCVRLTRGSS